MKKYWALCAFVGLMAVIVCMSQYAESAKNNYEESTKHTKDASVAKGNAGKADNDAKKPYKPPIWAKFVAWPEGVGAWAIILTLFAIVWQSTETREAAEASRDAVSATKSSIDALNRIERAWLVIRPHPPQLSPIEPGSIPPYGAFAFNISNKGRTAARIMNLNSECVIIGRKETLPETPIYQPLPPFNGDFRHGAVLVPDDNIDGYYVRINDFFDMARLKTGESILFVYSRIEYLDCSNELRVLQFCYRYMPQGISPSRSVWGPEGEILHEGPDGGEADWVIQGPPNYNTHT